MKALSKSYRKLEGSPSSVRKLNFIIAPQTTLSSLPPLPQTSLTHFQSGSKPIFSGQRVKKSRKSEHSWRRKRVVPFKPHSRWPDTCFLRDLPSSLLFKLFLMVLPSWRSLEKVEIQEIKALLLGHELLPAKSFCTSPFGFMFYWQLEMEEQPLISLGTKKRGFLHHCPAQITLTPKCKDPCLLGILH